MTGTRALSGSLRARTTARVTTGKCPQSRAFRPARRRPARGFASPSTSRIRIGRPGLRPGRPARERRRPSGGVRKERQEKHLARVPAPSTAGARTLRIRHASRSTSRGRRSARPTCDRRSLPALGPCGRTVLRRHDCDRSIRERRSESNGNHMSAVSQGPARRPRGAQAAVRPGPRAAAARHDRDPGGSVAVLARDCLPSADAAIPCLRRVLTIDPSHGQAREALTKRS